MISNKLYNDSPNQISEDKTFENKFFEKNPF